MATLGAATATVPQLPTNYQQLYTQQTNALDGHYARFFGAFHATTGNTPDELFDAVVLSTQRVPKILLARVTLPDQTQQVITLHRPSMYEHNLVEPAPAWNNRAIAFTTNIDPNSRFIATVIFPVTAFSTTALQTVPTLADMDAQVNATAGTTIGPYSSGDPNTEAISMCLLMPLPPKYLDVNLGKVFTPCDLWRQLGTTIINHGLAADCAPLLDWLHMAASRQHTAPPTANTQPLNNHLGNVSVAFPTAAEDHHLARHR